jgi:glycine/D-amino acid oxidase-like deaminating enzyme
MDREGPAHADFVVIGGGIMGASIAWQLAARKAGRVVLLERSVIAAGASGRTGALLRQHYTNLPEAALVARSLTIFRHWSDIVGGDCGFQPSGLIVTVPTNDRFAGNVDRMRRTATQLRSIGVAIEVVDAGTLHELDPAARFDDVTHATFESESGYVDAIAATRSMVDAARRAGVSVFEGVVAEKILTDDSRVTGVRTSLGDITTDRVIIATGPWSPPLARTAGVELPVSALRVQIAIFLNPDMQPSPVRTYVDNAAGIFCRPWGPGRTMAGIGGGDQHDPIAPDDCVYLNDPPFPAAIQTAMSRRFPAFSEAVYLHGHAGMYDMTPDAHPILGAAGPDGLYVAAGFSGAGFKKGPAIGEAMADLLLDGESRRFELAPFRLDRFASDDWHAPWSPNEYELASDFGHGF